jgi:hypothetical protein
MNCWLALNIASGEASTIWNSITFWMKLPAAMRVRSSSEFFDEFQEPSLNSTQLRRTLEPVQRRNPG